MAFRRKIIKQVKAYHVNKASYVKRGSRISKNEFENSLYEFMFEIELNEAYEENCEELRNQDRRKAADLNSSRQWSPRSKSPRNSPRSGSPMNSDWSYSMSQLKPPN